MQDDFQRAQIEVDRNLKDRGCRLVSMSYHEDPATHSKTHVCVVRVADHI
jgi:hypothetical protein